jgi:predicted DNA-binding antitoxin AbrB/MazE fold protein
MSEIITAIYEDGIFKPLQDVKLHDRQRVRLEVITEDELALVESQKNALVDLAGIGRSGLNDIARKHDEYLYQKGS